MRAPRFLPVLRDSATETPPPSRVVDRPARLHAEQRPRGSLMTRRIPIGAELTPNRARFLDATLSSAREVCP